MEKFLNAIKPYVKLIAIGIAGFVAYKLSEGQFEEQWMTWAVAVGGGIVGGLVLGNIADGLIDNVLNKGNGGN